MPLEATRPDRIAPRPRLRILLVLEATFAGAGRHVLDLASTLLELGHDVHLAYSPLRMEPRFADELRLLQARGLTTLVVPMGPAPGLADLTAIRQVRRHLITDGPFDVVHGHSSKGGAVARLAAVGLPLRRVYTPHALKTMDQGLSRGGALLYGTVERMLAHLATDRLLLVSVEEATHARAKGLPAAKLAMVPNGARVPDNLQDRAAARAALGIADDAIALAWIGRLAPQKAPERFVALMAGLRPELPRLHGVMLGYGELEARTRGLIDGAGLGSVLALHTDRRGWDGLAAADLLVLTSRYEAMPYVVLEARALGVPVVATDVGGLREAAAGHDLRIVAQTDDPEPLKQAVRAAIAALPVREAGARQPERGLARNATDMVHDILAAYRPAGGDRRAASYARGIDPARPSSP